MNAEARIRGAVDRLIAATNIRAGDDKVTILRSDLELLLATWSVKRK